MIEPQPAQRSVARRPVDQPPADQITVAQAMTRRASALRTAIRKPADPRVPTDQWYRREDP
ncbi:MAG: hypothetical protein OEZ14_14780, partial [Acidimicrobiia bacterium]|nr:hypothetical protein [Acidimicrobiia bacterium]